MGKHFSGVWQGGIHKGDLSESGGGVRGAAPPPPEAGAPSHIPPLLFSPFAVQGPTQGRVWLRSPQGWTRLGWSRLVRGLLPGWTPSRPATPCLPAQQARRRQPASSLTLLPEVAGFNSRGLAQGATCKDLQELVELGLR